MKDDGEEMIDWIQLLASFTGSMGFAFLFKLKGKNALLAGLAGGLAWFVYLVVNIYIASPVMCMLLASLALGCYAEVMAVKIKVPRTVFMAVGIIPLIPGAALYYAMFYFFKNDYETFKFYALSAAMTALAIAGGLLIATSAGDVRRYLKKADKDIFKKIL